MAPQGPQTIAPDHSPGYALKLASRVWFRENGVAPEFDGWQEGYGAFTVSYRDKESVVRYIAGQEAHHKAQDFRDEIREMLDRAGLAYDPRFLP